MKNVFILFLLLIFTMNIFPIVRGTKWGVTKQRVMFLEKMRLYLPRNYKKSHKSLCYRYIKVGGEDVSLTYDFINNKLIKCYYNYPDPKPSEEYLKKVIRHIVKKYGKPIDNVFSDDFLKRFFCRWHSLTMIPKKDLKKLQSDNHWSNKYTMSYTTIVSKKYDTLVAIAYLHVSGSTVLSFINFVKYSFVKKYYDSIQQLIKKTTPKDSSIEENF